MQLALSDNLSNLWQHSKNRWFKATNIVLIDMCPTNIVVIKLIYILGKNNLEIGCLNQCIGHLDNKDIVQTHFYQYIGWFNQSDFRMQVFPFSYLSTEEGRQSDCGYRLGSRHQKAWFKWGDRWKTKSE